MLKNIGYVLALGRELTFHSSHGLNFVGIFNKLSLPGESYLCGFKSFHSCGTLNIGRKKSHERARNQKQSVTEAEESPFISSSVNRMAELFPDKDLPIRMFNGIMFKDLPIINVKVTPNNTIMNLTDAKGFTKAIRTCGIEGFKNAKKGTNLAAQATALTFSRKVLDLGYKTVRVRVQGIGPGRVSSIRGLVMGGLEIVSVTDNTHVSDNPPRGKKLRRI